MTEPTVIAPGGGEVIGDSPERRVEVLCDDESLNATWSRYGPGREGADLHVHRRHSDLFYVLEGELTVRLGPRGEEASVPTGALARVPPNVIHGFRNAGAAEVRYLNFHAPGRGFADYLRSLRDGKPLAYDQYEPPGDGGRDPSDAAIVGAAPAGGQATVLADVEEIAVTAIELPDGSAAPDVHSHHLECFYVLEGELALTAAERELGVGVGTWLRIPAGTVHTAPTAVGGPARFLRICTPR